MKRIIIIFAFFLTIPFPALFAQGSISGTSKTIRDGAYNKDHIAQNKPVPYPYLSEDDVLWSKRVWRLVDFREKVNQVFYFPEVPKGNWWSFMDIIKKGIETGEITAYAEDDFVKPLKKDDVFKTYERKVKSTYRKENEDFDRDTIVIIPFSNADVKSFKIKEDWIFDKKRSEMIVRIIGIGMVTDIYDANGDPRGTSDMFWVYFPESRNLLAKHEVFNDKNGARRMNYDELLMTRRFNSIIIKEENNYDRLIMDYAKGLDALLESERIKSKLFEWENSLWVY